MTTKPKKTIRITVVEDNPAYARSIQKIIATGESMDCIAVHGSAEEYENELNSPEYQAADLILLDLKLPGKTGLEFIPILRQAVPDSAILVVTQNDDYRTVLEAIRLGALGYILKDTPVASIRRAIQEVYDGGSVIDPQLARLVLKSFCDPTESVGNLLSERERQVIELMALGHLKKEVADQLGLSYGSVALYTANIYKKLQVTNVAAAVGIAIRKGLI